MKDKRVKKPESRRRRCKKVEQFFLSEKNKNSGYYLGFTKADREDEQVFISENPEMSKILQRLYNVGKREVVPDLLEAVKKHRMKNGRVPTANQAKTWFGTLNRFLQDRDVATDFMETLLNFEMVPEDPSRLQEGEEEGSEEYPSPDGAEWSAGGGDGGDGGDGGEWSTGGADGGDGGDGGEWSTGGANMVSPKPSSARRGVGKRGAQGTSLQGSISRKRGKKARRSQYQAVTLKRGEAQERQPVWGKVVLKNSKRTLFSTGGYAIIPEVTAQLVKHKNWKKKKARKQTTGHP
jgi:hypothetical protein